MNSNDLIPSQYDGREQAWIKHHVLENYLKQLTAILGISTNKLFEFTYIDCFAGPWGDSSESMSATSIAISLNVLSSCKNMLESQGFKVKMRAIYVEENRNAHTRLKAYLESQIHLGIEMHEIHGEFVESRSQILNLTGNSGFAFFFIDPKGYTEIKAETLRPLLERPKSEFVINFMYDFINRIISMKDQKSVVFDLFGELIELDEIKNNREQIIVDKYRNNLKKLVPARNPNYPVRSAYATVLDPRKDRTKYHLIFITTHHKGIIKFKETYEVSSILQDKARATIRESRRSQSSGIIDMFSNEEPYIDQTETKNNEPLIDDFWLKHIGAERTINESEFADILESTNWFPKELQASLGRLISSNKVINLNAKRPRRTRHLHFEEHGGERLKII
jgi:three-Cys-motif partner protein